MSGSGKEKSLSFFEIKFETQKEQPFLDEIRQAFEARPPIKQISVGGVEEGASVVGLQPAAENTSIAPSEKENSKQVSLIEWIERALELLSSFFP